MAADQFLSSLNGPRDVAYPDARILHLDHAITLREPMAWPLILFGMHHIVEYDQLPCDYIYVCVEV